MHGVDSIPLSLGHGSERLVTEDTGVGNQDMNGSESVEGSFDDLLAIFGRRDCGNGLATSY